MYVFLEAVFILLLMRLGPAKTHTASGAANSPYQSLWQLLTRFAHTRAHKSPSPPSGAVAALGPFLQGTPRACPLQKAWGWEEGTKLIFSLALALQGSSRYSGGRFNDPLRPCFPPPRQLREALGHTSVEEGGNEPLQRRQQEEEGRREGTREGTKQGREETGQVTPRWVAPARRARSGRQEQGGHARQWEGGSGHRRGAGHRPGFRPGAAGQGRQGKPQQRASSLCLPSAYSQHQRAGVVAAPGARLCSARDLSVCPSACPLASHSFSSRPA